MTPHDNFTPSPESALKLVRRMVAEKRAEQKKMVEEYKNNLNRHATQSAQIIPMKPQVKPQPSPESALILARRMLAEKRTEQKKAIEEYKNDPQKQAIVAKLREKNAARRRATSL